MVLYGVGIGPGDPDLLTLKAADTLRSVDRIFHIEGPYSKESVSHRVAASLGGDVPDKLVRLEFSMAKDLDGRKESWQKNAGIIAQYLKQGQTCAFATIGDPMIYSTFVYVYPRVLKLVPDATVKVVPGITSFQAAAAKAVFPLVMDKEILSLIPASKTQILSRPAVDDADTTVFLKIGKIRSDVVEWRENVHDGNFLYAAHIGRQSEDICQNTEELQDKPQEYLSLIISKKANIEYGLE